MIDLEKLVLSLHDIGAVKFGRFQLASGKISPIYVDLRLLISSPSTLKLAAQAYANILGDLEFDLLGAIPYGGMPIGTAVSLEMDKPMIFPRKEIKAYGTANSIEGTWSVGQKVVIIEDLVTSGESALNGVAMLKAVGLQVTDIVVLLDREQGANATVSARGYNLHSVMRLQDMLTILENAGRIDGKTRREVLAALS